MPRLLTDRLPDDLLERGETWEAAQSMTAKGRRWLAAWLDGDGAGDVLAHRSRRHGDAPAPQAADLGLPTGLVVALTGRRVVVFDRSFTGRPRSVMTSWPVGEVSLDIVDLGGRVRSRLFVFGLPDGSVVAGETGINGTALVDADAFVDAFHELAPLS